MKDNLELLINESGPIKGIMIPTTYLYRFDETLSEEFTDLLEELVTESKIVELEYILESSDHRIKSMYFPKNTYLKIVGA